MRFIAEYDEFNDLEKLIFYITQKNRVEYLKKSELNITQNPNNINERNSIRFLSTNEYNHNTFSLEEDSIYIFVNKNHLDSILKGNYDVTEKCSDLDIPDKKIILDYKLVGNPSRIAKKLRNVVDEEIKLSY